jgi:TetR/AcrR family transcriptional repressor of nem operon
VARVKTFDPTKALARAMAVFWRLGYERASVEVLLREMGIAKQSLYDTFGDKRALYLKALACYRDQVNQRMRAGLEASPSVKDGFAKLLLGISSETRPQHARGCLLLSANLERDTADAAIADFLRDNQARVESIFVDALRRGQANGELSADHDPRDLARYVVTTIQGMRAMARLRSDRRALERVARIALTVFD